MSGEAHIVDIRARILCVRHCDRPLPKSEIINAIRAFGHCKKRFAVHTLHSHHKQIFSFPLYGS